MRPNERHLVDVALGLYLQARERKARVRVRLHDLQSDAIFTPCRGPVQPNGKLSHRWEFWCRSVRNHRKVASELAAVLATLSREGRLAFRSRIKKDGTALLAATRQPFILPS